jgi:riboflavin kinase/FMN adenylyltransferase
VKTALYEIVSNVKSRTNRVVTVGTFDGVHRGHLAIVKSMQDRRRPGDTLAAITFDPHPREVIRGTFVPKITTLEARAHRLLDAGIDEVIVVPFDIEFAEVRASYFAEEILYRKVGFHSIVIGHDHRFGKDGEGDENMLRRLGLELNFEVVLVEPVYDDSQPISSSGIRHAITDSGDVEAAARFLGRRYERKGVVVHGNGRGRTIGIPTANLNPVDDTIVPQSGVYAVFVSGGTLDRAHGVMNIGVRPTFGGKVRTEEVHVLDWDGDLYEQTLTVEFVSRLREERKFESVEALVNQLGADIQRCRQTLNAVY